jgi:hypothetical protein
MEKLSSCIGLQLLKTASYHGNFFDGNRMAGIELVYRVSLIQHVLELFLRLAFKSNELESKSITMLPTDDGEANDDRGPSARGMHMETHMRPDGDLDMALNLTSGERQIPHCPMA